jgi:deoxyadenosine/deoxycytidine kinase
MRYIAIEGVIGAGKSSLAQLLARQLNARLQLEEIDENPFLAKFYQDPRQYAFQTQLYFLVSRYRQQQQMGQLDLFQQILVSDYLFAKDRIFAYHNLSDDELTLYENIFTLLKAKIRKPDLVIFLQATVEKLCRHITERGRDYEKNIGRDYLVSLAEAYNHFFFHYDETPLVVVNTEAVDFVHCPDDLASISALVKNPPKGTIYFNPAK